MRKAFIAFIFLLSVFFFISKTVYAAAIQENNTKYPIKIDSPKPNPNLQPVYVPNQLIVTYKPGSSPQQLSAIIAAQKKAMANPLGYLKIQTMVFFGKTISVSSYENSLKKIQDAQKKAGVLNSEIVSISSESQADKVILKEGTNMDNAIKILKSLPQVKSVDRNYLRFTTGSRISSIESVNTDPLVKPNTYIVQYAPGQSPEEIKTQVEDRQHTASTPLLGALRIAAQNTAITVQGELLPEEKLQKIDSVTQEVGEKEDKQLLKQTPYLPPLLKNMRIITTNGTASASDTIQAYSSLPGVVSVEPVHYVFATATPNDTYYNKQWSLSKIQAPTAWDTSKGSDSITVAVIDSGVDYNHTDLNSHVVKGPDYFNNDNDPMDTCGHGTHVSGTIGALTDNSKGVAGVNWNVKILAIKVMDQVMNPLTGQMDCGGDDATIRQAIQYAADNGAKVINMSLGGPGACPSTYQDMIDYAKNKGVTTVVAAGNDSTDASNFSPANCSNVITVGASGPSDERASYSNFGSHVDIAAPGGVDSAASTCLDAAAQMILSTYPGDHLACMNGTSMASPHVAGGAALVLSVNPNLTPDELKNILIQNADPISTDRNIGPRLNLARAVAAAGNGGGPTNTPTPTLPPNVTPTITNTPTPTPTGILEPTATPTSPPDATPTPTPTPKNLTVSFLLPGIGNGGNTIPTHTQRNFRVLFMGEGGNAVAYAKGTANYQGGSFVGTAPIPDISEGSYQAVVSIDGSLPKFVPGFFNLPAASDITAQQVNLTSGDINLDNTLDILDYNMMIACIQRACSGNAFTYSDLNDDNIIDEKDLNVLLRSFTTRGGD